MKQKTYIAIDLKSFYASVECRERGLIRWTPISLSRMRAGRTRPSALPSLPPSRAMAYQGAADSLKSSSASRKRMPEDGTMHRAGSSKDRPIFSPNCNQSRS